MPVTVTPEEYAEFEEKVKELFPDSLFQLDNNNQIIIFTDVYMEPKEENEEDDDPDSE